MIDFYGGPEPGPMDQADGLRRMFAGVSKRFIAVVANPHVTFSGVAIERLTAALALQGRSSLIVDAADSSPFAPEAAALELAPCIERLSPEVSYLAARGLPMRYVNTRGSASRLLDELSLAAPRTDVVLVHAQAADVARLFTQHAARPVLLAADHPESVKDAYASLKLLALRSGWLSCDLLLVAAPGSPRLRHIAATLGSCADSFIGAALHDWATVDPACAAEAPPDAGLTRLVAAQMDVDDQPTAAVWQRRAAQSPAAMAGRH